MGKLLFRATRISVAVTGALVCVGGAILIGTALETGESIRELQPFVVPSVITIGASTLGLLCALAGIMAIVSADFARPDTRSSLGTKFTIVTLGFTIAFLSPFLFAFHLLFIEGLGGPFAVLMLVSAITFGVTSTLLVNAIRRVCTSIKRDDTSRASGLNI